MKHLTIGLLLLTSFATNATVCSIDNEVKVKTSLLGIEHTGTSYQLEDANYENTSLEDCVDIVRLTLVNALEKARTDRNISRLELLGVEMNYQYYSKSGEFNGSLILND